MFDIVSFSEKNKFETIFITYEEIIKSPYPVILYTILTKYKEFYSPYLNLSKIDGYDMNNLNRLCIQRNVVNIFEYLARGDFDFEGSLMGMEKKFVDLYTNSELLKIGVNLPLIIKQKFTEKVYIYTPEYDPRIHIDIQNSMGSMDKISYVSGTISDVMSNIPAVTSFILNDISYMVKIAATGKLKDSSILLASYGYNYTLDAKGELQFKLDMTEFAKKNSCEFASFIPKDLSIEDFSSL